MKRKSTKNKNKLQGHYTSSITFLWNGNTPIPNVVPNNIAEQNINDVFAMSAENLLAKDPRYYPVLLAQVKAIYDFMYENQSQIN